MFDGLTQIKIGRVACRTGFELFEVLNLQREIIVWKAKVVVKYSGIFAAKHAPRKIYPINAIFGYILLFIFG